MNHNKYSNLVKLLIVVLSITIIGTLLLFSQKSATQIEKSTQTFSGDAVYTSNKDTDGNYIGYIKSISSIEDNFFLEIDYIDWLPSCKKTEDCPNGYMIKNHNPKTKIVPISKDATIKMQTFSHQTSGTSKGNFNYNEIVKLEDFKGIINGTIIPPSYLSLGPSANPYKGWYSTGSTTQKGVPFWIKIKDGTIREITEQYIP